jgi:hypothetical protein
MTGPLDFDALVVGPCMQAFGEPFDFLPQRGRAVPGLIGVYTDKYVETTFTGGDEVTDTKTALGIQASQFPAALPAQNDRLRIRGRLWRIAEALEDGHGHILLHIVLASDVMATLPEAPPVYGAA